MDVKQIGANILWFLKAQNKTQVDLADALGTSKQVINKIIRGKKALKTVEMVAISNYLSVSINDIISKNSDTVEHEFASALLYGKIENRETADFIISLVNNLSDMEEELNAHGLLA